MIDSIYKGKFGKEVESLPPILDLRASNLAGDLSAAEILSFLTKIGLANTKDYDVVIVSASRNFLATDSGKILLVTANVTLTMPAGLSTKFRCEVDVKAAGLCTMVMATGVTWTGGAGLILDPQKMCTIYAESLNAYRIKGETKA